jgi:hypothetical protein
VTGEVSALEHEFGDDTVEATAGVSLITHVSLSIPLQKETGAIRSRSGQYTIHGSSWPFWGRHRRITCCCTTVSTVFLRGMRPCVNCTKTNGPRRRAMKGDLQDDSAKGTAASRDIKVDVGHCRSGIREG